MNKVFKKIWSQSLGCIVVVSENTRALVRLAARLALSPK
ncbi:MULTISPECIES: ESPR-type extended signal peptide-containing protein [Gammaproteobacteria]|nr:hypothetical protein [Pseudomonas lundensis]